MRESWPRAHAPFRRKTRAPAYWDWPWGIFQVVWRLPRRPLPRTCQRKQSSFVMPQLRAAEGGTAECAEHADGLYASPASCPAPRSAGDVEGLPCPRRARAVPFTAKNAIPHVASRRRRDPWESWARCPCHDSPARRGVSFLPYSLRLCAFALICCSLLASSASAGYPPETEGLRPFMSLSCSTANPRAKTSAIYE